MLNRSKCNPVFTNRFKLILGLFLIIIMALSNPLTARADFLAPNPPPALYVLDEADILSEATENKIIATSQALQSTTKAQVAVVTLGSLNGSVISDAGLAIARKWKLGDSELNNGLLILVAPSERMGNRARIEVGYGLEGAIPDSKAGYILDECLVPSFTSNSFDDGILATYMTVVNVIAQEYGVIVPLDANYVYPVEEQDNSEASPWQTLLLFAAVILFFGTDFIFFNGFITSLILSALSGFGGRGGGRGGGFGGGGSFGGGGGFGGGGSSR